MIYRFLFILAVFVFSSSSFSAEYAFDSAAYSACTADYAAQPDNGISACQLVGNTYKWVNNTYDDRADKALPWCSETAASCTDHIYTFSTPGCTNYDPVSGLCGCSNGSLDPSCSVNCPPLQYTYHLDGVARSGSISGGKVGYGQSCPAPSFPAGSNSGCVGSVGSCSDFEGAIPEHEPVVITDTTKTETTNTDGSSSTSESSSSGGSGGGAPSYEAPSPLTGTDGKDSNGNDIDPLNINNDGAGSDLSDNQIELGGDKYQLCNNGGIANSSGGCDYISNSCGVGQVDSVYGCVDIPDYEPPENNQPQTTTNTDTSVTVTNPDGSTTTTTTTTTVTNNGSGEGVGEGEEGQNSGSSSADCDVPPVCSGDAIQCAQLQQEWQHMCNGEVSGELNCAAAADCDGDAILCAIVRQQRASACALLDTASMASDLDALGSSEGLVSAGAVESEMELNGYQRDSEVDLTETLDNLSSVSTVSGSCPASFSIDMGGHFGSIEVDMTSACSLFEWIGAVVRLAASLVGFMMIFSTIKDL